MPSWAIQLGSFASERAAREAASGARRAADSGEAHVEAASQHGRTVWRAQLTGLTAAEAQGLCATLARRRAACLVLRPDPRQLASR
jgi:D-alanyl-D-alanine carboxypeptidase